MKIVQICVGSSCHLKGSEEIIHLLKDALARNNLESEVTLAGSFCTGKCNRNGTTVIVDDETYTGITKENFNEFFNDKILKPSKI